MIYQRFLATILILQFSLGAFAQEQPAPTASPSQSVPAPIFSGEVKPLDTTNQPDLKRLAAGGAMQLGMEMGPGEYVFQIVVTDPLAKEKYRTATQWIDFEIFK